MVKIICDLSGYSADYILFGEEANIMSETKSLLKKFSKEEVIAGCKALKKIALLIREDK